MPEPPHARHILLSLRVQIQRTLADTNLGKWAQLLQYSVPYWPYKQHPALRLLRRKSFTGSWHLNVSPPHFVIYVCVNLRTGADHTNTRQQRVRKHYTDAHARTDSATFQSRDGIRGLGNHTCPVYRNTFSDGSAERAWWSELKKWVVNDAPPGICESNTSNKVRSYLSHRILSALREIQVAKKTERLLTSESTRVHTA